MPRLVAAILTAVLLLLTGPFAASSLATEGAAEPAGGPVILDPLDGAVLETWDSRFRVDFTNAPDAIYDISATWAGGARSWSSRGSYGPQAQVQTFRLFNAPYATNVTLSVTSRADSAVRDSITFRVEGHPTPRITDISDGETLTPWDGQVDIDFTGAAAGDWTLRALRNGSTSAPTHTTTYDGTAATVRQTLRLASSVSPGQYNLQLVRDGLSYEGPAFTSARQVKVTNLAVPAKPIYPTVRDGFRDDAKIAFNVSEESTSTVVIRNAKGRKVFVRDLRTLPDRKHRITWRAKGVEPGRYKVTVTATGTSADTYPGTARARIDAVTDTVMDRKTITKKGTQTSKRIVRGNCFTSGYSGELRLDCWGSSNRDSAEARYAFKFPANAQNLRYTVRGEVGCCDTGTLTRSARRTSQTSAYVFARVTFFRAYTVHRVSLTYKYERRR